MSKRQKEPYLVDAKPINCATNLDLEEQIRRNPDDESRRLVYADWLTTNGDPRGELASLQSAFKKEAAGSAKANELSARIEEILKANDGFRGGVSSQVMSVTWNLGLFDSLRLMNFTDWMDSKFDTKAVARRAFDLPCAVALNELRLGVLRWEYQEVDVNTTLEEASKSPFAKTMRVLKIGDIHDIDIDNAHHQLGNLERINDFPALEELSIWGSSFSFKRPLDLPKLRSLSIQTCGFSGDDFKHIANAKLPKVEKLDLWFGSEDYGASVEAEDIKPIVDGTTFPELRHLGICNSMMVDDAVEFIIASKTLPKLETLDLSQGILSEKGARILLEHPQAWKHLKQLDVSESYLTDELIEELKKVGGPTIIASDQKDIEEDSDYEYRYVSMAE